MSPESIAHVRLDELVDKLLGGRRAGRARARSSRDALLPHLRERDVATADPWAAPSIGYPVRFEPHARAPRTSPPPTLDEHRGSGFVLPLALMRLLIVHHTPSPAVHAMFEAVHRGATDPSIEGVDVVAVRPALTATAIDVFEADGYSWLARQSRLHLRRAQALLRPDLLPVSRCHRRPPYRVYLHGNNDTTGALRAVDTITTGLQWERVQAPLTVVGAPSKADLEACWEFGAALAAASRCAERLFPGGETLRSTRCG